MAKRKRPNRAAAVLVAGALLHTATVAPRVAVQDTQPQRNAVRAAPVTTNAEQAQQTAPGPVALDQVYVRSGRGRRRVNLLRRVRKELESRGVVTSGRQWRKLLKAWRQASVAPA